jgi:RHS repeat-associated protein
MYDDKGNLTGEARLDMYDKVANFAGCSLSDCPFRYQGQYEDAETGLYYNRFRYYSPEEGMYLSQDPIGLKGGVNLYSYVHDTNGWVDPWGLLRKGEKPVQANEITTYGEFRRRSVVGDNLEGHEFLQHAVLQNEGLVNVTRLSGDVSKLNPVIALPSDVHDVVSARQLELGTQNMKPVESIESNAAILREVGVGTEIVADLEEKAKKHLSSLCN